MDETVSGRLAAGEVAYWLALVRTPGLGSRGINELLEHTPDLAALFDPATKFPNDLRLNAKVISHLRNPDWERVEQDLEWLATSGNHLIAIRDPEYPPLLRETPDPPPVLFVHGDPGLLALPQLAIVGSRNPSASGEKTAHEFARFLAAAGMTITSGLATGIDGAGHRGALAAKGTTIAVMGTGLDRVYPARHRDLAREIAQQGALVSEFPPGTPARAGHFPRRNRIISGLSLGTLVVEAALRSGSLITAKQASEQGREVFAIPGSIHNPLARGCHALIRQGAKLVETAEDIMEELGALIDTLALPAKVGTDIPAAESSLNLDADYRQLLDNIGFDPSPVDLIIKRSGMAAEEVSSMLLLLELEGYVSSAPGGGFCRTHKN